MRCARYAEARNLLDDGDYYVCERTFAGIGAAVPRDPSALRFNLQLLRGIGPRTEERLKGQGYPDLASLAGHARWGTAACRVLAAIEAKDCAILASCGAAELDLLGFYSQEDIAFLDIETTGLYSTQPLFLVGVMGSRDDGGTMVMRQFVARSYEEEAAVLRAVRAELERFTVVATYNGRRFDLPYIRDRMAYHGIPPGREHLHVDVLRLVRRSYRGRFPDHKLTTVASHLLGYERHGDIPSYMIPEAYHEFVRTRNPALIRPIIEHNAMDISALALILASILGSRP